MYTKRPVSRICQGDIFEGYVHESSKVVNDVLETLVINFPFIIILTQDCDLESDSRNRDQSVTERKNNDKYLQEILFAPAYKAESFRAGDHLSNFNLKMETFNTKTWPYLTSNQKERYHYFPENQDSKIPALVVDFKHYYTLPREDVYAIYPEKYKVSIDTLYREDLSQRFAHYLSRIGLPERYEPPAVEGTISASGGSDTASGIT